MKSLSFSSKRDFPIDSFLGTGILMSKHKATSTQVNGAVNLLERLEPIHPIPTTTRSRWLECDVFCSPTNKETSPPVDH
ncbi:hypothetical protein CEXT_93091 [Caerostris extrusa]|uniref:Uncharacterized protein n=1 Tax=Caerostris extrusa TaxID=172846 RepID=A0AAV4QUM9_CAEEX|nr:hypothetical protein CEXT_93091 [Caerostris extrusa]